MPDPRFFQDQGPVSLRELANLTGAALSDATHAGRAISLVAPLNQAGDDAVSFLGDRRYLSDLAASRAGACFVSQAHVEHVPKGCVAMVTSEPQVAWAKAAGRLHLPRRSPPDGPPIHPSAELEDDVEIAAGAVVGSGAKIGKGSSIGANAVIGPGVAIGRGCSIGAGASVGFALVGDRVHIYAGAVIGEAGFGVAGGASGVFDVPQLGRVILQDGVMVGANSCVDRGAWEDTVIGENTKIDNLVQIGHNTRMGRNCLVVSQTGISGSVVVGDGVQLGGQVGVADHLTIGDGAAIKAQGGVIGDVPAGEVWWGTPAMPYRQWLRQLAWLGRMAKGRSRREGE